jgi:hypothetical protein
MLDLPVTFKEAMAQEKPTLAEVFEVILTHLRGRKDVAVFGAYAVNAYVEPPRMTADIDIMSTDADALLSSLCDLLRERFHIAVRVRSVANGRGFRIYQLRKDQNRHLVDVRSVDALPTSQEIDGVMVVRPEDLVILKLQGLVARRNTDKGLSDRLDLHRMLLTYPEYRATSGPIFKRLHDATPEVRAAWVEILAERIDRANDDEY